MQLLLLFDCLIEDVDPGFGLCGAKHLALESDDRISSSLAKDEHLVSRLNGIWLTAESKTCAR
jgi:hypothetical protein